LRQPLDGALDVDGDGIDDVNELRHAFLDPLDTSDAGVDADGDGRSNLEEFGGGGGGDAGFEVTPAPGCEPWPTGRMELGGEPDSEVPEGYGSLAFSVTLPDLPGVSKGGWLALGGARGPAVPKAVMVCFTGDAGNSYWTDMSPGGEVWKMGESLRDLGFTVVQVRWSGSWWSSVEGVDAGTAGLAGFGATVVRWAYDNLASPGGVPLYLVGQSAGGSLCAYALSHYGLDPLVARAVISGGPPFAALATSCLAERTEPYGLNPAKLAAIDRAHGIREDGPAVRHDPAWVPRWEAEAHATGGNDFSHPGTRISLVLGERDPKMVDIAGDWRKRLEERQENRMTWTVVPGTGHQVYATPAGRSAVFSALVEP
jgi:hypothetical protein